jgi:hypothetical protein
MFYHKNPPPHLATPEIGVTVFAKKLAGALLKSVHKKKGGAVLSAPPMLIPPVENSKISIQSRNRLMTTLYR